VSLFLYGPLEQAPGWELLSVAAYVEWLVRTSVEAARREEAQVLHVDINPVTEYTTGLRFATNETPGEIAKGLLAHLEQAGIRPGELAQARLVPQYAVFDPEALDAGDYPREEFNGPRRSVFLSIRAAGLEEGVQIGELVIPRAGIEVSGLTVGGTLLPSELWGDLEVGQDRIIAALANLPFSGRLFIDQKLQEKLPVDAWIKEIGEDRIEFLPEDGKEIHSFLDQKQAGSSDLVLLAVSPGTEREFVPLDLSVPVVNLPGYVPVNLTLSELATLAEMASRRQGKLLRVENVYHSTWNDSILIIDTGA
jgi:hypothetical protein